MKDNKNKSEKVNIFNCNFTYTLQNIPEFKVYLSGHKDYSGKYISKQQISTKNNITRNLYERTNGKLDSVFSALGLYS